MMKMHSLMNIKSHVGVIIRSLAFLWFYKINVLSCCRLTLFGILVKARIISSTIFLRLSLPDIKSLNSCIPFLIPPTISPSFLEKLVAISMIFFISFPYKNEIIVGELILITPPVQLLWQNGGETVFRVLYKSSPPTLEKWSHGKTIQSKDKTRTGITILFFIICLLKDCLDIIFEKY